MAKRSFQFKKEDGNYILKKFCDEYATSVVIPDGVTTIGEGAFWGDYKNLEKVTIPDSVTSIEGYAFTNRENLISKVLKK